MRVGILILVLGLSTSFLYAQKVITPKKPIVCYGDPTDANTVIEAAHKTSLSTPNGRVKTSTFDVTYIGFTNDAKNAFQAAVDIWSSLITTSQPIKVVAEWKPLGTGVLGSAIWGSAYADFTSAPNVNTYYPVALAEKIAGKPLNHPDSADIVANFSSTMTWSYDLTGTPVSGKYDLMSVVLHELGHGLGFVDSYSLSGSTGYLGIDESGYPMVYDLSLENNSAKNLFENYAAPSTNLGTQLVSNNIYFNSPLVLNSNGNSRARIYAPTTFSGGSSISHLDETTYGKGNVNSLMTPAIGAAEIMHDPGPIVKAAFSDMGWVFTRINHTPTPSTEDVNSSFEVTATLDSDVGSTNALTLHYNTGGSDTNIAMQETSTAGVYSATIPTTNTSTTYNYYISVNDAIRSYTLPGKLHKFGSSTSQTYYSFTAASDNTPPVITHTPEKIILNTTNQLAVTATVTDNLGVELVWVDYYINNVKKKSLSLPVQADNTYSFKLPLGTLSIGDVITYRITARDTAVIGNASGNLAYSPSSTAYHTVNVTGLQEPRDSYSNNFNTDSDDFYGNGFSITTPSGFANGAIHSDHPYKPGEGNPDNVLNLNYELLVPIHVKAVDATIRFDEIVLVEPGETGAVFGTAAFYDYVVVEGSIDGGNTWTPVADGYDAASNTDWLARYNSSETAIGDPSLYRPRELNLLNKFFAGQDVVLRFRLYSDPLTAGWGWAIDNLRIQIDETPPLVLHDHVDFISPSDLNLPIHFKATDNSGIKDVNIEYIYKGETTQYPVELTQNTSEYLVTTQSESATAGDTIQYRIICTDKAGNTSTLPTSGFIKTIVFQPGEAVTEYTNDFNSDSNDFIGNFFSITKPSGFSNAMINSEHNYLVGFGLSGNSTFSYMLKNPIILNASNPYIKFDEIALVEGHSTTVKFGSIAFNDYVIVQGSADGGTTWKNFSDGYDAADQTTWLTAFFDAKAGASSMYKYHSINMLTNTGFSANDQILIRFSLFSNSAVNGWGWAIDNVAIQSAVTGTVEISSYENFKIYPNPATTTLNIELNNITGTAVQLNLMNVQGANIQSAELPTSNGGLQYALDTADLHAGLYLIKLNADGKTYLKKFVIE